jgi:hypothetical protein
LTIPIFSLSGRNFLASPIWRRWVFYIFPLLGYAALIFYESSQSRWLFEPPDFFSSDKVWHLLEYGIFGVLLARIIDEYGFSPSIQKKMVWVLVISFFYGLSDEFHQWFIPGRFATLGDVLADTLGGGIGGFIFLKFKRKGSRIN